MYFLGNISRREISTFRFTYDQWFSLSPPVLISNLTYQDSAQDSDNALTASHLSLSLSLFLSFSLSLSTECLISIISRALYRVYKTAEPRERSVKGLRLPRCHGRLRDEELFLEYFRVTSSLDCGDRPPRAYLWIEFARFPGKLVSSTLFPHVRSHGVPPRRLWYDRSIERGNVILLTNESRL